MSSRLPLGKLPPDLLSDILAGAPMHDPRVIVGPGIGLDCAVVDCGERLTVYKSDPITFATDLIGYYLVQVNANDIATTGAKPLWLLVTLLLPEHETSQDLPASIMMQIHEACAELGITVIGGHTEITAGLDRPIAAGTMVGEVAREMLVTPRGARPGDRVLVTKGVPIEAISLLAREFPERLRGSLSETEIRTAQNYLRDPGIGITRDARIALSAGRVTAMHDPTEGGVATALWELAEASGHTLLVDPARILVPVLARRVCETFAIDPLCAIASGALLITAPEPGSAAIQSALSDAQIACTDIGVVADGPPLVQRKIATGYEPWPRPVGDDITKAYAPP
jgi:hydrogenase expression/formation protein HypE